MKNIKDLGEKEVILCKTIAECEAIAELIDESYGYVFWKKQQPYKTWYIGEFLFYPLERLYGSLKLYNAERYTIHNAKDFIQETTKQVSNEVKEELQDILKEWEKGMFQKGLNVIIRERLK